MARPIWLAGIGYGAQKLFGWDDDMRLEIVMVGMRLMRFRVSVTAPVRGWGWVVEGVIDGPVSELGV